MKSLLFSLLIFVSIHSSFSQIDSVSIQLEAELEFPDEFLQLKSSIASRIDTRDNGYVYSANLVFGLGIYSIADPSSIISIKEIETSDFENLSVSTCQQVDHLLYVGLGDFQKENEACGLAILDITDPANPIMIDIWTSSDYIHGVSHIDVYDEVVYLSMMNDGLLVLDVSNAEDIQFVSDIIPDLTFPSDDSEHHQGRGITKVGSILYYTFDRGGFRAIDVSDIYNPIEIEKYINQDLIDKATAAYNDVVVIGDYAYVSVDYCGLEVIDISTSPWTLVEWYDPVDCQGFNWFGAEIHTNELVTACNDSLLFVSGGNSEIVVFDISDPNQLNRIGDFFELDNELAAYGLHVFGDKISVSYISNPLNIPYVGNWGGLKLLSFSKVHLTNTSEQESEAKIELSPNPVASVLNVNVPKEVTRMTIYSELGAVVKHVPLAEYSIGQINVSDLAKGSYILVYFTTTGSVSKHFIKM